MEDRPLDDTGSRTSQHTLPAVSSSVPLIRHEIDRILDPLRIATERAADIRLAVTEACTNAVQHAYPARAPAKALIVMFETRPEALVVSVLDSGRGIDGDSPQRGLGVGLPVIEAVADSVVVENLRPGTRVKMTFYR